MSDAGGDPNGHLFRWLLSAERGSVSYSTGIARIKELQLAADGAPVGDLTLHHEMVHQLHAMTTPFLFSYCERLRSMVLEFARWLNADPRPDEPIADLRQTLGEMEQDLERETGADPIDGLGFSARHLLEGVASLEPLHPLVQTHGAPACLERLQTWVNGNPIYLRAAGATCRVLGPDDGLRLFSTLAFVALHGERPGQSFAAMLRQLNERPTQARQMTSAQVLETFLPPDYTSLIQRFASGESVSRTPLWNTVGHAFATSGSVGVVLLAAANPSTLLFACDLGNQLAYKAVGALTPPITITEAGQDRLGSIVTAMPEPKQRETVHALLQMDELTGAMLRFGLPHRRIRNSCFHTGCPEHKGHLCSLAFPPPNTGNWSECMFRQRFLTLSGISLENFAYRYGLVEPPQG